eukprot:2164446-Pleurochrysis_carterae.AAC.1
MLMRSTFFSVHSDTCTQSCKCIAFARTTACCIESITWLTCSPLLSQVAADCLSLQKLRPILRRSYGLNCRMPDTNKDLLALPRKVWDERQGLKSMKSMNS